MSEHTNVLDKLACALGRRDEVPNQELARDIATKRDKEAVKQLVAAVGHKDRNVQSDSIKVLYELAELQPAMVARYYETFLVLLSSKNNRMQWGAMCALSAITQEVPAEMYAALPRIMKAADNGSVITRDHAVRVLAKLCSVAKYKADAFELLCEQVLRAPVNQLPSYAESAAPHVDTKSKAAFLELINTRLSEVELESKRKRLLRVMKMVNKVK
ncbi:MAG: hypothetical protein KF744_02015 [Taibaiella sp.]|nr:hypothetical protein [Taibaiella sp.]